MPILINDFYDKIIENLEQVVYYLSDNSLRCAVNTVDAHNTIAEACIILSKQADKLAELAVSQSDEQDKERILAKLDLIPIIREDHLSQNHYSRELVNTYRTLLQTTFKKGNE